MTTRYLLGADALLELCAAGDTPTSIWARSIRLADCRLSVVAVGIAQEVIQHELATDLARQRGWTRSLRARLAEIERLGVPRLHVTEEVVETWIALRRHPLAALDAQGNKIGASQDTRLVIATASCHGLTLAEPAQPYHATLQELGIQVQSLA